MDDILPYQEDSWYSAEPVIGSKGHYIVLCRLDASRTVQVGRLGRVNFSQGFYAYVGSALAGLEHRLRRHLGPLRTRQHWHIDYLLAFARPLGAVWGSARQGRECPLAESMAGEFATIRAFGSTDCSCPGHLFHAHELNRLVEVSGKAFRRLGRKPGYVGASLEPCDMIL